MKVGKVLLGTAVGVVVVAAAPFTGGGSVLAATTVAASLSGSAAVMAVAAGAGGAAVGYAAEKVDQNQLLDKIKYAKKCAFEDGWKDGAYSATQEIKKYTDYYLSVTALSYYMARCDGSISQEEQAELDALLETIYKNKSTPKKILRELSKIKENQALTFEDVASYLDSVAVDTLLELRVDVATLIEASDGVSPEEIAAQEEFEQYLQMRIENAANAPITPELTLQEQLEQSTQAYVELMDEVTENFQKSTAMTKEDAALCVVATLLQCVKVYAINAHTVIQKAGKDNNNEKALHQVQHDVLHKFKDAGDSRTLNDYYAPLEQIITVAGVPYDVTGKVNFMKGANHRFTTLGHDPVLGLVFGTANILTNTITGITKEGGIPVPCTNHVQYNLNFKNPKITQSAETLVMLERTSQRVSEEPQALVAALIKQLIHIGTDLYTPCGIQIPAANLVLDVGTVEKITKYISAGDVLKFQASSLLGTLIDTIISALHRCMFVPVEDEVFDEKLYEVRTKKILLYSNLVAVSLNVTGSAVLTKDIKTVDWSGIIKTLHHAFLDEQFVEQLQYDYLNQKTSEVYDKKFNQL